MKYKIAVRCVIMVLCSVVSISAFAINMSFEEVSKHAAAALKEGNAKKLEAIFDNRVNLSLKKEEGTFTKFQVALLLDDFFRSNKVEGLKEVQRANNASASFVVFSLKANSKDYRVFIKFAQSGKEFKISEIRIE